MLIFKHTTSDETYTPGADVLPSGALDFMPYRLEAAAALLGEDWELGFLQGSQFHPVLGGAALAEHDRSLLHYEEGEPYLDGGVAHRSLVLRANSLVEVQAVADAAPWDAFKTAMLSAPLMNSMILAAFATEPVACVGLTDAIAQARQTGDTSLLEEAMGAIIAAAEPDPADLAAFVAGLAAFNLPSFMGAAFARLLGD